jgi:hypothetical protein
MRLSFVLAGLCALSLLTSCGGPAAAKYFKIAVDASALGKINEAETPACFVDPDPNAAKNSTTSTGTNNPAELEWTLWEGADGVLYLEVGTSLVQAGSVLGDAPDVIVKGMIQGDSKALKFEAKQTTVKHTDLTPAIPQKIDETRITSATITFKDLNSTTSGTIAFQSSYSCAATSGTCPDPKNNSQGKGSCQVSLPFVARQVPVTEFSTFGQ